MRAELAKLGPRVLITGVEPMDGLVYEAQSGARFSLLLIGVFANIAVLHASVGLYGVLATIVRQCTAEIGLRMALGVAPARIFRLVVSHGLRLSFIGIGIGLAAAVVLTRAISPPWRCCSWSFAGISCWVPAARAAGLDPSNALREE